MNKLLYPSNALYLFACLAGFFWQVTEISMIYFKYDVVTRVAMNIPIIITVPGVSACFRYTDLLDFERINRELPPDDFSPWTLAIDRTRVRHYQKALTIAQVLNYTPPTSDALDGCRVRTPKSYKLIEEGNAVCSKLFRVQKFFVLEYICYKYQLFLDKSDLEVGNVDVSKFTVESDEDDNGYDLEDDIDKTKEINFTFQELSNTPAAPGLIFSVTYKRDSVFKFHKYSKFVAHTSSTFPYKAVGLSPVIDSNGNLSERSLTYFKLTKSLLRAPFKTNCFDYKNEDLNVVNGRRDSHERLADRHSEKYQSRTDCHQVCVKTLVKERLNKIPFSSIETRRKRITPLSYDDVMNETTLTILTESYNYCDNVCRRPDCRDVTTFTRISSTEQDYLEVVLNVQNEPSIKITFQPVLSFPEYFTYFLSCFGTWFGISVIALNPFKGECVDKLKKISKKPIKDMIKETPRAIRSLSQGIVFGDSNHLENINSIEVINSSHFNHPSTSSTASTSSSSHMDHYHVSSSSSPVNVSRIQQRHDTRRQVRVLEIKIKNLENLIKTMQRKRSKTM